jgi:geranylgeranylglycerol-phosphate geranylgeranyltransferase
MTASLPTKIKALLMSMRPQTTPLAMIGVYVGGLVAGAPYNSMDLILAVFAAYFITSASMPFNDYIDRKVDEINHPNRAIPRGIISPKGILVFSLFLFAIGIVLSFFVNWFVFAFSIVAFLLIMMYELYTKNRGIWSNMTVAFVSAMAFTFGGAAAVSDTGLLSSITAGVILSAMTFFAMTGREIIMDIRDSKGDELTRKTVPHQLGCRRAAAVANVFLLGTIIIAPLPYFMHILSFWYLIVMALAGLVIVLTMYWMYHDTKNAALCAETTRLASAIGLVAFIIGMLF